MLFRNRRAAAALSPLHALRLCQCPVPAARFQREASYHTVARLFQVEVEFRPAVAVRAFHVTFGAWKNFNNMKPTRRNISTGDPTPVTEPTFLADEKYHMMADVYFDAIVDELEELPNYGSNIVAEYEEYGVRLF